MSSIPHIPLVELNVIFAQKLAIFVLKCLDSVMCLLIRDVMYQIIELAVTDGKITITALPEE